MARSVFATVVLVVVLLVGEYNLHENRPVTTIDQTCCASIQLSFDSASRCHSKWAARTRSVTYTSVENVHGGCRI